MSRVAMVDTGSLVTSVNVPGTDVSLVYDSSAASSSLSSLTMVLTPDTIPESLHRVHVKITVAGLVIKKVLEAEEGLVYKYSWNKRNVYNQKVYGSAAVRVSVGYQVMLASHWSILLILASHLSVSRVRGHGVGHEDLETWRISSGYHEYRGLEPQYPSPF